MKKSFQIFPSLTLDLVTQLVRKPVWVLFLVVILSGCKKEYIYQFEVDDVNVTQPGAVKPNVKTDIEFISVAYTDLFGTLIPQNELDDLALAYSAFGDKKVIIDMIILNFLNDSAVDVPTEAEMDADVDAFVENTYQKFYVRQPTEFEKWFVRDKIQSNPDLTPELVYYAFLTSNEYRYY